ncbi:MAG: serine/threonine protein kinase [Gammaproteobacteria bacterium]|nr:serine/threonine protein kinase [Gammaproteobacteria bacterium]
MSALPETIGKYRIMSSLGEGAMGVVYEGFDPDIERRVAIKILHPRLINEKNGEEFLERFKREARSAARCVHPNVVTVLEYGQDGDMPYIVMEFVEGSSLDQVIKRGRAITLQSTLSVISGLLKALEAAHKLNIVHRDIKAANVMILKDSRDIKLADFGIARIAEGPELTMTGAVVGTPRYMAPEQMFGLKVDYRADLFSVAMVFLELLTLMPKNSGIPCSSLPEITNLPPNNRIDYTILYPTALIPILLKGLSVTQDKRFQNAREFINAIKRVLPKLKSQISPLTDSATAVVQKSTQKASVSKDELSSMTKLLIDYVGPIAKNIMVEHESGGTSGNELATLVAREIPQTEDREAFLKQWEKISGTRIDNSRVSNLEGVAPAASFDDDMLRRIQDDYAGYIGPLADRLVRHFSKSSNNLQHLVNALAAEIPDQAESQKFRNSWI